MLAEIRDSVRQQTGGRYEVLGELARDDDGSVICLARSTREHSLVALSLGRTGTRVDGSAEYSVDVLPELDESLIPVGTTCPACGTAVSDGRPSCSDCGTDLEMQDWAPPVGLSRTEMMRAVRDAAGSAFEVLGEMPRAGGNGTLYFAREIATGRVVALSLRRETDESGAEFFSLGVTQVLRRPEQSGPASAESVPPVSDPTADVREVEQVAAAPADEGKVCPTCGAVFAATTRFCPTDGASLLTTSPERGLVGRTVADRYHILELIGEGGFGKVYLAEHARMGRRCALKIIDPAMRNDADTVGRFSREAANASRINHPNIATIYDFGESAEGLVYLVMEYVDGDTLADVLAVEGRLPPERAAEIARQICEALIAAHGLGIVHRDLKPQNILLTKTHDGAELVKVVDFGIAKAVQGEQQNITRAGFVIGTLEYMSPEQLMGTSVDGRSDIFSLGCVLFEMLTGERAFAGPDGPVSIGRRMTEDPPRVSNRNPSVPQSLDEIVAMTVAREAAERFQSAEGLRDALAGVVRTSTAERLGLVRRATGETPSATGLVSSGSGSVESAVATQTLEPVARVAADTTDDGQGSAPTPRPAPRKTLVAGAIVGLAILVGVVSSMGGDGEETGIPGVGDSPLNVPATGDGLLPRSAGGAENTQGPATQEPATLYIGDAVPTGARLTIDGRTIAERSANLDPGAHEIRVSADGYAPADTVVVMEPGQVLAWTPVLRPLQTAAAPPQVAPPPAPAARPGVTEPPVTAATPAPTPEPEPDAPPADAADPVAGTVVPPAAPPPPSPAEVAVRINETLDRFARALESRQITAVDAAYPGMTATERQTWAGFLGGVRTLTVELTEVQVPPLVGESLQVPFTMSIAFADQRGSQETVQRYLATIVQSGGEWRLAAIRPQ